MFMAKLSPTHKGLLLVIEAKVGLGCTVIVIAGEVALGNVHPPFWAETFGE
jgi:hypothetical protein